MWRQCILHCSFMRDMINDNTLSCHLSSQHKQAATEETEAQPFDLLLFIYCKQSWCTFFFLFFRCTLECELSWSHLLHQTKLKELGYLSVWMYHPVMTMCHNDAFHSLIILSEVAVFILWFRLELSGILKWLEGVVTPFRSHYFNDCKLLSGSPHALSVTRHTKTHVLAKHTQTHSPSPPLSQWEDRTPITLIGSLGKYKTPRSRSAKSKPLLSPPNKKSVFKSWAVNRSNCSRFIQRRRYVLLWAYISCLDNYIRFQCSYK